MSVRFFNRSKSDWWAAAVLTIFYHLLNNCRRSYEWQWLAMRSTFCCMLVSSYYCNLILPLPSGGFTKLMTIHFVCSSMPPLKCHFGCKTKSPACMRTGTFWTLLADCTTPLCVDICMRQWWKPSMSVPVCHRSHLLCVAHLYAFCIFMMCPYIYATWVLHGRVFSVC